MLSAAGAAAQTRARAKQIGRIAEKVADAFASHDFGRLDRLRLFEGKLKLVIDTPTADYMIGEFQYFRFRSFMRLEQWLTSRENNIGLPFRLYIPFRGCRREVCRFESEGGILHNRLYVEKVSFYYRKKRPFIKAVYLLYG